MIWLYHHITERENTWKYLPTGDSTHAWTHFHQSFHPLIGFKWVIHLDTGKIEFPDMLNWQISVPQLADSNLILKDTRIFPPWQWPFPVHTSHIIYMWRIVVQGHVSKPLPTECATNLPNFHRTFMSSIQITFWSQDLIHHSEFANNGDIHLPNCGMDPYPASFLVPIWSHLLPDSSCQTSVPESDPPSSRNFWKEMSQWPRLCTLTMMHLALCLHSLSWSLLTHLLFWNTWVTWICKTMLFNISKSHFCSKKSLH